MGYKIAGEYVTTCSCALICPCSVDGPPTTKDGKCNGSVVFHITEGSSNGTDLAGVDVAMIYFIPGNASGGNWRMGLVFDPGTADDKVKALEDIFHGKSGGPFADFLPLIAEFIPTERGAVTYTSGTEPSATIGKAELGYSPILGGDGNPTVVRNAMFGFAPEYELGRASGSFNMSGIARRSTASSRGSSTRAEG